MSCRNSDGYAVGNGLTPCARICRYPKEFLSKDDDEFVVAIEVAVELPVQESDTVCHVCLNPPDERIEILRCHFDLVQDEQPEKEVLVPNDARLAKDRSIPLAQVDEDAVVHIHWVDYISYRFLFGLSWSVVCGVRL